MALLTGARATLVDAARFAAGAEAFQVVEAAAGFFRAAAGLFMVDAGRFKADAGRFSVDCLGAIPLIGDKVAQWPCLMPVWSFWTAAASSVLAM